MLHTGKLLTTPDMTAERAGRAAERWKTHQWDQRDITKEESALQEDAVKVLTREGIIEIRFREDTPLYIAADYELLAAGATTEPQRRGILADSVFERAMRCFSRGNLTQGIRVLNRLREESRYNGTAARERDDRTLSARYPVIWCHFVSFSVYLSGR